ncbi:hypothetical protein N473_24975 [Pseudoalteromonas luteoviolacea CPMOR-1]|uniref:DUF3224 domain-containing protein n=1 Tax=Pseudoalteromonas luteoviolacea CPMOR-1 TaxID=1365248 RepID=A0A167IYC1_9GAMM|nr:DUF3224 domain-containing protein [Pseudoalteromonas luteoviolacea]KZN60237.1 hypothetical protein N473_24975 [Pseudoalteromonas luteoviolacea CPMOR-1]
MKLAGIFQVIDWQESDVDLLDNETKITHAIVQQTYKGDLVGTSTVHYLLYYDKEGNAAFNGLEIFKHESNEESTLVIRHEGRFKDGIASSNFSIINCEYNQDMIGKTGSFKSIEGQKSTYLIE